MTADRPDAPASAPPTSAPAFSDPRQQTLARLVRPLRLTRAGMLAERVTRAFWPLWSILIALAAALFLGLHETVPVEAVWASGALGLAAALWAAWRGARAFRFPTRDEAVARLDATLPGRPLQALADSQAIGATDDASVAVWAAHVRRMADRAAAARAVEPDLRLSSRDPYALRYVALTFFVAALLFGSVWRAASVTDVAAPGPGAALAAGPAWEGWVEPPLHTGKPSLYLNDIAAAEISVPAGSRVSLRLYGEVGALRVEESVSGRQGSAGATSAESVAEGRAMEADMPATAAAQSFEVAQDGRIVIEGAGGRAWDVAVVPDGAPSIAFDGAMRREANGQFAQPFAAEDDYGVIAGRGTIRLDLAEVDRRHGLSAEPDPREALVIDLPLPISGDRAEFAETIVEDFSKHPWSGLPVEFRLTAIDASGNEGYSRPLELAALPGRRFFDPLANALIEQRRDLLWSTSNAPRVAQVIRAVSHRPDDVFRSTSNYLQLRFALMRLETATAAPGGLDDEAQEEIAEALWQIALDIEEGDLSNAMERLRRAQDRLAEAIRNGASDEEIAQLMQELREAMQDYMNQLAQQQQNQGEQPQMSENMQEMTGDQLQQMLDRLQQLMEEGRTAEAQQLLEQLRQMMENMQVTQGQPGQGQQSPGQQAMEGLAETLREQQGLSDESFRNLQEQFNPGQGQPGQQFGQGQQGQDQPGQGRQSGRQGEQSGQGQSGQGQPGEPGRGEPGANGMPSAEELARRQGQLRRELDRQMQNLPGAGSEEGRAARDSLGRAGEAMDRAEDALRGDDLAGAIDEQAQAMEALREGMRNLGEALAQQQQQGQGQQGEQVGESTPNGRRDPLGRDGGNNGPLGTQENLLQGEDVYRRARDLLDEIRRRAAEQERPEVELDYLRRLLDRF
ncbi:MAG: TIGR02302 family protein [Paracoccaceae bacterium]|jgi:uncharacterized protein (TIGR02302 family)|nr:TIGR02302 family protein [Paracoccaceae bacterium]